MASITGHTWPMRSPKTASDTGSCPSRMRSRKACRCGDVYSPGASPACSSTEVTIAAVLPLPLVPVTWTVGVTSCGSPSRRARARMRSSLYLRCGGPAVRSRSTRLSRWWSAVL